MIKLAKLINYFIAIVFVAMIFFANKTIVVACSPGETRCVSGFSQQCQSDGTWYASSSPCGSQPIVGTIDPPEAIYKWKDIDGAGGGYASIGLINFLSMLVRLATIIGGIIAMLNFVLAGLIYVTSAGSSDANSRVKDKLTYSLIGVAVIVSAYTVTGIIGLVFFGDAGFILAPKLEGALTAPSP